MCTVTTVPDEGKSIIETVNLENGRRERIGELAADTYPTRIQCIKEPLRAIITAYTSTTEELSLFGPPVIQGAMLNINNVADPDEFHFSPDGRYLRVVTANGAQFVDTLSGKFVKRPYGITALRDRFYVLYDNEGERINSGSPTTEAWRALWQILPVRKAMVSYAESFLTPAEKAKLKRERIRIGLRGNK